MTFIASLLSDYRLRASYVVPFRTHLMPDVAMGVPLAASPWLFSFAGQV